MAKDKIFSAVARKLHSQWKDCGSSKQRTRYRRALIENRKQWEDWFRKQVVFGQTRVHLPAVTGFGASPINPIYGSEYSSIGTIMSITADSDLTGLNYLVRWDNGEAKSFRFSDLRFHGDQEVAAACVEERTLPDNPNMAFKQERWDTARSNFLRRVSRPLNDDF